MRDTQRSTLSISGRYQDVSASLAPADARHARVHTRVDGLLGRRAPGPERQLGLEERRPRRRRHLGHVLIYVLAAKEEGLVHAVLRASTKVALRGVGVVQVRHRRAELETERRPV